MNRALWLLLLALCWCPVKAESLSPAQQREALEAIASELRCPMSPNLTVLESEAAISFELKGIIGQQLAEGKTQPEIIDYLAARYGDQIRYRPEVTAQTALLWGGPALLLLLLLALLVLPALKRRKAQ